MTEPESGSNGKARPNPPPVRVLIVPHLTELSGAPLMAVRIARALDPERFRTRLVFPRAGLLADRAREDGLDTVCLDLITLTFREALRRGQAMEWLRSRQRYSSEFDAVLAEFRPDLVYIHSVVQPIPGVLARRRRIRVAWHVHETLDPARRTHRWRRRCIERCAHALIFCGWTPRHSFGTPPENRTWQIVPNALTREVPEPKPERTQAARRQLAIPESKTLLITIGGVVPEKGLDILLAALGDLRRAGRRDFKLLVVGGGLESAPPEFQARIETLLDEGALRDAVAFLGHRDDIDTLLAAADVFVLASRSEGLPLSVVEAFAAGVPAILTDVGDCARLTGNGERGYTVAPEDPPAFARALEKLLDNPEARCAMGQRALQHAREHFQFPRYVETISRILEETARRRT